MGKSLNKILKQYPSGNIMKIEQLQIFAELSAAAYLKPTPAKKQFRACGYKMLEFIDRQGAQVYLLSSLTKPKTVPAHFVLAFRGTELSEPSDIKSDLIAGKYNAEVEGKVHRGFREECNKVSSEIFEAIKNITPESELYITGHSLGGAMATIYASRLQDYHPVTLVTFGSPRVGTKKFVNELTAPHYRVVNDIDIVTNAPPTFMKFRHHGQEVHLDTAGALRKPSLFEDIKTSVTSWMSDKKLAGLHDHSMINYVDKLNALDNDIEV